jgi:2-oxoglutarate dehydrogenase E1 component
LSQQNSPDLSQVIAEEFGANATYVETLLQRFRSNPELVDDSWRAYFSELTSNGATATVATDGDGAAAAPKTSAAPAAAPAPAPAPAPETKPQPEGEVLPIRGPALKIVENMESSLSVPTATSERRIPVKLLDENRRIINQHLAENDRGKASYTHLIAWAVLRAIEMFPQLNDGYANVNNTPSRVKRKSVNLGVAIDLTKKDGTRTLLVPNIKNANALSFSEFLAAYDDVVTRAREGKLQISDFQGTLCR